MMGVEEKKGEDEGTENRSEDALLKCKELVLKVREYRTKQEAREVEIEAQNRVQEKLVKSLRDELRYAKALKDSKVKQNDKLIVENAYLEQKMRSAIEFKIHTEGLLCDEKKEVERYVT